MQFLMGSLDGAAYSKHQKEHSFQPEMTTKNTVQNNIIWNNKRVHCECYELQKRWFLGVFRDVFLGYFAMYFEKVVRCISRCIFWVF